MAEYNPSKIIKDGNTYNFRDTTKIPLAGSNQISGSLIPATTNTYDLGGSQHQWNNAYIRLLTVNGGAVLTSNDLSRTVDDNLMNICGGTDRGSAEIQAFGKNYESPLYAGSVRFVPANANLNLEKEMLLQTSGTWTWNGTACQLISDQRLKQQIAKIDDKLLDAWKDVNLVQFKYNDAVEQKSDNARLHTGYVVQQIDEACKSHGVDVSKYGLYCHEEYPQETEEVEVEQEDGTKVKERKVIREASEHYSLRYTEALIVECAYLRKCIKELRNEIEELKSSK